MPWRIPDDAQDFDALMREIDRELIESGCDIPGRPINAIIAIGKRFGVPMPFAKPPHGADEKIMQHWPVAERIYRWYDERCGDRTKVGFSPGRMVILVEGDPWVIRFPQIYGSVRFAALRTTGTSRSGVSRGAIHCNVVELIEDMPAARISGLSGTELGHIHDRFMLGLKAFGILEASAEHELVRIARGDIAAAISRFMARPPEYGQSKWASLQAAEKVLKAAIALAGGHYLRTHDLNKLADQARQVGIQHDLTALLARIQCSPGIRYGAEPCNRDDAISAHHASLELITKLYEAGLVDELVPRQVSERL